MLREGVELEGGSVDYTGLTAPDAKSVEGIEHSGALLRFADAFMGDDESNYLEARRALTDQMGVEAMVDAVGVASNFQRMDRIADSTGIPSDGAMVVMMEELNQELGLNEFVSASNTPGMSGLRRLFNKLIVVRGFRAMIRNISKAA